MLTKKGYEEMEKSFLLKQRAIKVLALIAMEFKSDPMSVQCFDASIVKEAIEVANEFDKLPDYIKI